ncbi:DNA-directed RNA polymerase subunit P [Thermoproteus sp. CP80]|jgi:DNA-directed RNA polymerase subunit P|nr:MAG: DNA-directed RNA polymerase subunit P [Thermoproteus sp. JCHS_4]PLC66000.1 DNA-directed RNA polymerase subunit P [Thermoproteus sp. CP80]
MGEEGAEEVGLGEAAGGSGERKIYMCMRCGRTFSRSEMEILPGIRCPYCNYKIILKVRSPMVKRISAV